MWGRSAGASTTGACLRCAITGSASLPAEVNRVFEPYYRASNAAGAVSGSGIGLAGTRHIVQQHGGEIAVASEVGDTTFTVRLPINLDGEGIED